MARTTAQGGFTPLSAREPGDSQSLAEEVHQRWGNVRSITSKQFAEHYGVPNDDPRVASITDKRGKIKEPFRFHETRKRIDAKDWSAAFEKEWASIMSKKTLYAPMRLSEIRDRGIDAEPVPTRMLASIKSLPSGAYDKHKFRCIATGHDLLTSRCRLGSSQLAPVCAGCCTRAHI